MAKTILSGVGGLLGIKKKKKAEAVPAEQKGPIVTPLANTSPTMRRRLVAAGRIPPGDILGGSNKLGG